MLIARPNGWQLKTMDGQKYSRAARFNNYPFCSIISRNTPPYAASYGKGSPVFYEADGNVMCLRN